MLCLAHAHGSRLIADEPAGNRDPTRSSDSGKVLMRLRITADTAAALQSGESKDRSTDSQESDRQSVVDNETDEQARAVRTLPLDASSRKSKPLPKDLRQKENKSDFKQDVAGPLENATPKGATADGDDPVFLPNVSTSSETDPVSEPYALPAGLVKEKSLQLQPSFTQSSPDVSVAPESAASATREKRLAVYSRTEEDIAVIEREMAESEVTSRERKTVGRIVSDRRTIPLEQTEEPASKSIGDSNDVNCPGAPDGSGESGKPQPEDLPLEQEEHPYDAPAASSTAEPDTPAEPAHDFTARELEIHRQINRCFTYYLQNPETVVRRGPWALMHAVLPFGVEAEVIAGNQRVNAIGWMCYNGVCARQRMFQPTQTGFRTNVGPGVQGHEGQFLAILAQSRVKPDYPLKIGNRTYTINDLVRFEAATCREKSELTFKLIGLSYYLPQNQRWRDNRGQYWTLEKMLAEELAQPVNGAACGGSHRLMGLSFAVIERTREGLPITGVWSKAEQYLNDYIDYTMTLQNPDGSFSTEWFEGRGNKSDVERKVQTTGHMLEWLIYTLPDEHLRSPRIQLSMEYLLKTVGANPGYDWPIGPRGHALRAMSLYNQRVFGVENGKLQSYLAQQQTSSLR